VIWATRAPTGGLDPAEYLRIAAGFARGDLPQFGGLEPSAYWPPGYPAVLAPFAWLADHTGWISLAFAASLVNVVAGTATIWLTGLLARRWIGPLARNPAAWLVALCPALVYWTSTPHTETFFTPLFLGVIVLSGTAGDGSATRRWLAIGLLVGGAFLVRSPGVIALAAPALVLRAEQGTWRGALRATGLVLAGAAVLLVPWAIRNGVQVGIWSPASTNNASAACFGHHDGAQGAWEADLADPALQEDCFGGSPYDDRRLAPLYAGRADLPPGTVLGDPDEVGWYREKMADAVSWAVSHPIQEIPLSIRKAWATWGDEGRVLDGARNFEEYRWAGRWHGLLDGVADLWLWVVGTLALLGLAVVPACRRALPIWGPIALFTLAIIGGVAEPHYRYPVVPLVAVLAAGFLTGRRRVAA